MTNLLKTPKTYDSYEQCKYSIMLTELQARAPKMINTAIELPCGLYYICPKCHTTIDRDYQLYCNNCGQKLSWDELKKVKILSRNDFLKLTSKCK